MNPRSKKTLLTITAIAALAAPGVAQARHGADDPVGHVRNSGGDDVRSSSSSSSSTSSASTHKQRARTRSGRHGAHHTSSHRSHGADDGPNHG